MSANKSGSLLLGELRSLDCFSFIVHTLAVRVSVKTLGSVHIEGELEGLAIVFNNSFFSVNKILVTQSFGILEVH